MRQRRGNYMILFAFLLPLMLGFLALAIDIGRIRVAAIQAEGAAEAAAAAALVELRAGGSLSEAEASANAAAAEIRTQRSGDDAASHGYEYEVEVKPGAWSWADGEWVDDTTALSGVSVNVTQRYPLGLLFAPAFNLRLFGGGTGANASNNSKRMQVGVRAAMRPRDIVLVIDVSREMTEHLDQVQARLNEFVDAVAEFGIERDRVAVVVYAGRAAFQLPFTEVATNAAAIRTAIAGADLCNIGDESWYKFYRFYEAEYDLELAGGEAFNYYAVDASPVFDGEPRFVWDWENDADIIEVFLDRVENDPAVTDDSEWLPYTETNWYTRELSEAEQCAAWDTSAIMFTGFDPRVAPAGEALDLHPSLYCHQGNFWEGDPDRYDDDRQVTEVSCPSEGAMGAIALDYNVDSDGLDDFERPDHSYAQAGSNPGSGLGMAVELLAGEQPSRGEPTVLWVTSTRPVCGPNMDDTLADDCVEEFEAEMVAAIDRFIEMKANTHIVLMSEDPADEAYFSDLVTGRGELHVEDDATTLAAPLDRVSRNIRLQVVR